MAGGDIAALKRGLSSLKLWHFLVFAVLVGGFGGLQISAGMAYALDAASNAAMEDISTLLTETIPNTLKLTLTV